LQQVVTRSAAPPDVDEASRFRSLLIIAAAVCVPFLIAQVALSVWLTPIFADMYVEAGITVRAPQSVLFSLSHGALLLIVLLACDALLFLVTYLLARRYRPWLLFIPPVVFALTVGAWVPLLYMPLFDSMNIVK
jgi:type II secretory pathway component PulF